MGALLQLRQPASSAKEKADRVALFGDMHIHTSWSMDSYAFGTGGLLTDIYLQNRQSFEIRQAGGAQARIKDVEIVEVKAQPTRDGADLSLQVVWAARGEVDHWGHRHSRRNLYEAIVDLGLVGSAWKIVGLETLEERRIEPFGPVAQAAEIEN